ncbi:MAG TPA: 2-amino-4-hydroxy-6-hydroxymethyldihydropteridine diphosphokinase [Jatrophihabitans sp.]|jgi:2-amino-4-hydroxy-6-hydroxymethyldihydropteridine diphosphokinase
MSRAVLSIGSNLDDRVAHLRSVVEGLSPYLVGVSAVFQTPPWGGVEQQEFYNAILIVDDPEANAADWLRRGQECEQRAGRTREVHWGPRTLDVDVLTVDDVISEDPALTLPHPRLAERAFVLVPWWSLDPEAMVPGRGSVLELMQALPPGEVDAVQPLLGLELRS